jgi:diguanylate cyclase (GGDEF)-like protein
MKARLGESDDRDARGGQVTSAWRQEHGCSGLTSRLILAHVEREAGGQAVRRMLAVAGMDGMEDRLRDENSWFSFETKLALFRAAEQVLGDPDIAEHVGASALDLSVAMALKRTLRALGTPALVYGNVARANAKFNWAHELVVVDRGTSYMRMRYTDVSGVGYHRHDCAYTKSLLATVPQLFGLPLARVRHTSCGVDGAPCCEYEIRWTTGTQDLKRAAIALAVGAGALAGVSALLDPALIPVTAGVWAVGELGIAVRAMRFMARRLRLLELRVSEQDDAAERLLSSLEDLSSDLRLDEVLDQITAKAQTAVGGKEFVLLLADGGKMRADRHSGIPAASLSALESWADQRRETLLERGAVVIDDLRTDAALVNMPLDEHMPFGSMCAAPLVFREGLLGALVALAHGSSGFLPGDSDTLSAYAAHAAIALTNARLVDRLEHQAAEDPLTGLANRRAFYGACAAESSRMQRDSSELSIVMLDLDHFKAINDEHGHLLGDQVLVGVADALRSSIRRHDTVARMGGEEFAILMPDANVDAAYEMAERVRGAIARIPIASGSLSCSAGVVSASIPEASPAELLDLADKALYEAKRAGRDRTATSRGRRGRSSTAV